MTNSIPQTLEEAIRHAGEGWILDFFAPRDKAMDHIRQTLRQVSKEAEERLGTNGPQLSEESLLKDYLRRPHQVRGFFQALGGTRSPHMLLMVWRLLQGMDIKSAHVTYERQSSFNVNVVLETPYGEADPVYSSTNINDFALFRHIGLSQIDSAPLMNGFYPLRGR